MMEEGQYFVNIREPVELRRALLGSSKQVIQLLQRYEQIKLLRVHKTEKMVLLRALNKEINLLFSKLKKELPATDFRVRVSKEEKKPSKKREEREEPADDLKKLEYELRLIEDKIGRLSK